MEQLLTVQEVANILRVTPVWIYRLVRQKRIPFYHVERCVRFLPSEIDEWLEKRRNQEWHRDKFDP